MREYFKKLRHLPTTLWSLSWRTEDYWITRFAMLRLLGFVYAVAFLILINQGLPLLGSEGLTPATNFLSNHAQEHNSLIQAYFDTPTLFLFFYSDTCFKVLAWIGFGLSILLLIGFDNAPLLFVLWFLYLSFVHVGSLWYGYGWESQLLETGFLAIFLTSFLDPRPFASAPSVPVVWLFRWLTFRIMLGSGLIKLRSDPCWWDLSCLNFHFETQPLPNPLSRYFHYLPEFLLEGGVIYNHLAEIVAPLGVFGPQLLRVISGTIMAGFQVVLIFSGNLSFLNWLTLIPILACFSDRQFRYLVPSGLIEHVKSIKADSHRVSHARKFLIVTLVVLIGLLSINPVKNLLSERQVMNTAFSPFRIVNTYGAFGSVGRNRPELIVKGTRDLNPSNQSDWETYEFKGKPDDPDRTPPQVSPYHYRLDWQIWFAAMSSPRRNAWIFNFVHKLLRNDPETTDLLQHNPFPDRGPRYIKIDRYRYRFAPIGNKDGQVWHREKLENWLPPVSLSHERFRKIIKSRGWWPD